MNSGAGEGVGGVLYRMFGMLPRFGRRLLSAKAHLTGEFTPPSWAFTGSGYVSLRADVCLPLSSHDVAVTARWLWRSLRRPMSLGCGQESSPGPGTRSLPVQPCNYRRGSGEHLQAWASEFLYFDRLNLFPWG